MQTEYKIRTENEEGFLDYRWIIAESAEQAEDFALSDPAVIGAECIGMRYCD